MNEFNKAIMKRVLEVLTDNGITTVSNQKQESHLQAH